MREPVIWLGLLLAVLVLLYGGLNLAERGIAGIMAPAHRQRVFSVSHNSGKGPGITLTFAGATVHLYIDQFLNCFDRWQGK